MLLAIDIGNSAVKFGVFAEQALVGHWRMTTEVNKTADEFGLSMLGLLACAKIGPGDISAIMLSSVVPSLDSVFSAVTQRFFGRSPCFVTAESDTGLRLAYTKAAELGADRLVNAAAAYARYRSDLIVVDFGTATTFSLVSADGCFLGGAIASGVATAADALFRRAARLPNAELTAPPAVIGTDTLSSLRSGLVLGHAGMVDTLVRRMQAELQRSTHVVATGGLSGVIVPISQTIQEVRPLLTLEGLELLYRRARQSQPNS